MGGNCKVCMLAEYAQGVTRVSLKSQLWAEGIEGRPAGVEGSQKTSGPESLEGCTGFYIGGKEGEGLTWVD